MKLTSTLSALALVASIVTSSVANEVKYTISLSGPAEAPPNTSPGTGTGLVTVDLDLMKMRVETTFSGLEGTVSAAHIHCCTAEPNAGTAGVATPTPTFPGFPSGVSAGSYDQLFDLTAAASYNATFITNNGGTVGSAMNAMLAGFDSGKAYLNIHSSVYAGGEIRGFLTVVPEPASATLLLIGLGALAATRRGRTRG